MQLGYLLYRLIEFYELLICVMCIMSWFPMSNGILRDIYEALRKVVDPYLDIFRGIVPSLGGMPIDISPILGVVVLDLIKRAVIRL